jgi:hypothetical protein
MTKNEVKEHLKNSYKMLVECYVAIEELNKDGHQFDFCTDSRLADIVDNICNRAVKIQNIVYQGK